MADATTVHSGVFQHLTLEGTPYQVGSTQGTLLKDTPQAGQAVRDTGIDPVPSGCPPSPPMVMSSSGEARN